MQLPTQEQFVKDCLSKYRWEPIPSDQKWEEAHFPMPKCSGEGDTVMLWAADHTVQGLLQSVELDHQCFHGKANKKDLFNLTQYYPEYLPLFKQLKSQYARRKGKKSAELKLGVCGRSVEQMTADGKKTVELKLGIHGRSAEQIIADSKKGGEKAAAICKANGTGAFFNPKIKSENSKKAAAVQHSQRWQCLVTSYISTPCGLSHYQKKRGIDTKLRVKLTKKEIDDLERKS